MMDQPDIEDEYIDIRPWPIPVLIGRLASLVTVGRRGILEAQEMPDLFEAETDRFELQSWAALELQSALTANEARILAFPMSGLRDDDLAECADALLAATAIAWSLRVVSSPTLTLPAGAQDERRVLEWTPAPWTNVRSITRSARIRSDEELAREREKWEVVVWRATLFQDDADRNTDQAALAEAITEVSAFGLLPNDGTDLKTDAGASFAMLSDEEMSEVEHVAGIRLRTLNWVCGFGEDWETAPLLLD